MPMVAVIRHATAAHAQMALLIRSRKCGEGGTGLPWPSVKELVRIWNTREPSMRHAMSSEKMRPYGGGVPIPKSSCADALSVGVHMNSAMYMTVSKQAWSCRV